MFACTYKIHGFFPQDLMIAFCSYAFTELEMICYFTAP